MLRRVARKIPGARRIATMLGLTGAYSRQFLLDLLPKGSEGMEIGVHEGEFSARLLEALEPRVLHLVDPWKHEPGEAYEHAWYGGLVTDGQAAMDARYERVRSRFRQQLAQGRVTIHRCPSTAALARLDDASLDWVYIDGNHRYEFVKADLELALDKVRSGGIIAADDYSDDGWWEGGVRRACDEFARWPLVELLEVRNGQAVFRKE